MMRDVKGSGRRMTEGPGLRAETPDSVNVSGVRPRCQRGLSDMDAAKILAETGCTLIDEPLLWGRDNDILSAIFEFEGRRIPVAVSYKSVADRSVPVTAEDAIIQQLRAKGFVASTAIGTE